MIISSLITVTALSWVAKAFTLLPLGDHLTSGFAGDDAASARVCSYRYALQKLASSQGVQLEVLGSRADDPATVAACSEGLPLSGSHEGHHSVTGNDIYNKIPAWMSSPSYAADAEGKLTQKVDAVVLSIGQSDCLSAKPEDLTSDYASIRLAAKNVKWVLWELHDRMPGTHVLVLPILLPSSASEPARECAAFINDKVTHEGWITSGKFTVLSELAKAENLIESNFVQSEGGYLPTGNLRQEIAQTIWEKSGATLSDAEDDASISGVLPIAPERIERARMEEEGEGDAAGAGGAQAEGDDEDQYGYAWCLDNYDQNECFDYYYGYDWCTENYDKDECFDYYYGYDWCVKYYDQQECHDYYYGEEEAEDAADEVDMGEGGGEGSGDEYGYEWCLENYDQDDCFDYYYGYKWCLDYYDDDECYDYYYPPDFDWNETSNYKWCLNFYLPDDCETRYYPQAGDVKIPDEEAEADGWFAAHKGTAVFGGLFGVGTLLGLGYWAYQRSGGSYSRLDPHGEGDELL